MNVVFGENGSVNLIDNDPGGGFHGCPGEGANEEVSIVG